MNLYFATSNQISIYKKLNLILTSSIYLVFLPLEMQKRPKETKVYHMFFWGCFFLLVTSYFLLVISY